LNFKKIPFVVIC